jgi:RimJ/RimL family protein N-acetyltransferase
MAGGSPILNMLMRFPKGLINPYFYFMFELQPSLQNEFIKIEPLLSTDFERLYQVASDPLIWEQHPNKERYQREVFKTFFEGAIESGGAFLVFNNINGELIGSSRYYEYFPAEQSIAIGYTFISRSHWGGTYNPALKKLMLDHAFRFVDNVIFHIGVNNVRSQKAIEKLGAEKLRVEEMKYHGEQLIPNFVYRIKKENWVK